MEFDSVRSFMSLHLKSLYSDQRFADQNRVQIEIYLALLRPVIGVLRLARPFTTSIYYETLVEFLERLLAADQRGNIPSLGPNAAQYTELIKAYSAGTYVESPELRAQLKFYADLGGYPLRDVVNGQPELWIPEESDFPLYQ